MPVLQYCSLFIQWTWLASELLALEVQKKGLLRQNFRYWFVVLFFTFCEGSCTWLSQLFWLHTRRFKMIPNSRQVALDLISQFLIYSISGSLRLGHVSLTHLSFSFEKGSYSTLSLCSSLFWIYHMISSVLSDKHLARWPSISICDSLQIKRTR